MREEYEKTVQEIESDLTLPQCSVRWPRTNRLCFPVFEHTQLPLHDEDREEPGSPNGVKSQPVVLHTTDPSCATLTGDQGGEQDVVRDSAVGGRPPSPPPRPRGDVTCTPSNAHSLPDPQDSETGGQIKDGGSEVGSGTLDETVEDGVSPSNVNMLHDNGRERLPATTKQRPMSSSPAALKDIERETTGQRSKSSSPAVVLKDSDSTGKQWRLGVPDLDSVEGYHQLLESLGPIPSELPQSREGLVELRTQLAMELLWIKQAITSRQSVSIY